MSTRPIRLPEDLPAVRVGKIPSLDGLRAVSILAVIASHIALAAGRRVAPSSAAARVVSFFNLGHLGVIVFFVISGYLITHLLLGEFAKSGTVNLKRFYFRRTLRIFPPLYVLLAVLGAASASGIVAVKAHDLWAAAAYISNYAFPGWYTAHTWSLAVEEQFYLLWPLCFCLGSNRTRRWICLLVMCVAPVLRGLDAHGDPNAYEFYRFTEVADSLATGCLLALIEADGVRLTGRVFFRGIEWFLAGVVVALALWPSHRTICPVILYAAVGTSAINLSVGIIVFCVVTRGDGLAARILNLPGLAAVGVLSYSLYLWQQCFTNPDFSTSPGSVGLRLVALGAVACLSYWLIERPSLKLRARWEKRIFGGETVQSFREKPLSSQMSASSG